MWRETIVLRTKLTPPQPPRQTLARARVDELLRSAFDHRVTILQASTGYGKSTALAQLVHCPEPLFWYSASQGDADAQQFLAHLISAFRVRLVTVGDAPLALLQERGATIAASDALLNELSEALTAPALLVIDDYHFASSPDVNALLEHFLEFLPPPLHVIVSSRYPPAWDSLASWRARGQVLEIKRDALAFTHDEIAALFHETYGIQLAPREIDILHEKTEGWSIALQLVRQELRENPNANLAALFERDVVSRERSMPGGRSVPGARTMSEETLFAYLARDVLAKQPSELQAFLLETSVLRELDVAACDAVRERTDSELLRAEIIQRDLFVTSAGEGHVRYHHLFEDFLRELASRQNADAVCARHKRAAEFYRAGGSTEDALYHLFRAGDFENAAQDIERVAEDVVRAGRLDTLAAWIDALPPATVAVHPFLIFMLGELARMRSRYDDALAWYAQAEREWRARRDVRGITRALRGQALVYLDTVRPAQAEGLLQETLRLTSGLEARSAQARLLELLAENKLNMGRAQQAEELRAQAQRLRNEGHSEDTLSVRVKLRTGQLDKALTILETWAEQERDQLHAPRAVRETFLILSLIYAMQGRTDESYATAREGIAFGTRFDSPFVTAIGLTRLGHAEQVRGEFAAAQEAYQSATRLADQRALPRLRAEIMWGLTRVYGYRGDLAGAQRTAGEGIQEARDAGDEWVVSLVQLALGASHVLARQDEASIAILNDALAGFRACGDRFGRAVAHLWLALAHSRLKQNERAFAHLDEALALGESERYDYLFTMRTLHGWQDARVGVPLLLEARKRGLHSAFVNRLLTAMHLEQLTAHPGFQLRVQTLGAFRVWRGETEIRANDWQRRKARQLLQLLITYRGRMLEREEIFELLWANESPDAMARDFKVALNQVNRVLEPERATDETTSFIERVGTAYGFRAGADVWLDADEFAQLIAQAEASQGEDALLSYRRALTFYQDDYLIADTRYDAWASAERERLLGLYLRAADRLAAELFARGAYDECLTWCEKILARDRCWEHAYRLTMRAHAARGDHAQARRVFEQCAQTLRSDLDVEPSPATIQVFKTISR